MVFAPYPAKTGAPCVEPRATGDSAPAQSGLSLKWGEPTHGCTTNRMGGFFETNFWLTLFTLRKIHNFSINGGFFHVKNLNSTGIQWVDQICWIWGRPIVRAPHQALHLLTRDRNFGQFRWVSHIFPTKKGLDFTNMTNKYKWDVDSAIGPLRKSRYAQKYGEIPSHPLWISWFGYWKSATSATLLDWITKFVSVNVGSIPVI